MNTASARENMVLSQLRPNKINNKALLNRFEKVEREMFVDGASQSLAYADAALPMGPKRKMFKPLVTAQLLEALDLNSEDNVLIVAGGTGYSACLIAPIVKKVVVIEQDGYLYDIAARSVRDLHLNHVDVVMDKPEEGASKQAPFTKILVDAAIEELPQAITDQLADGGKLAAVMCNGTEVCEMTIFNKKGKTLFADKIGETKADVLPNFTRQERFVF